MNNCCQQAVQQERERIKRLTQDSIVHAKAIVDFSHDQENKLRYETAISYLEDLKEALTTDAGKETLVGTLEGRKLIKREGDTSAKHQNR